MKNHLIPLLFVCWMMSWPLAARETRLYGNGELSCNLVTDICQDKDGFIWIGTASGLNRFDGWNFTRYYHSEKDTTSLLSNYVFSLYVDQQETMWVGTNKGLQRFLPSEETFRSVLFPDNYQPSVECLIERHNGELWAISSGGGVYAIDRERMVAESVKPVNEACGTLLLDRAYKDRSEAIWIPIGSTGEALRVLPEEELRFEKIQAPGAAFAEDDNGVLYLAYTSGVSRWDPEHRVFIPLENKAGHFLKPQLLHSRDGRIYIGTNGQGISYIDVESQQVRRLEEITNRDLNLQKIKVESMIEDKDGNLWIGCFRKGVLMIPDESSHFDFWDFSTMEFESGDCISSIYKDREGQVWAGAENGELFRLNANGQVEASYNLWRSATALYEDSENTFWIGANWGGLLQFDKKSGKHWDIPSFRGKHIKAIVEDQKGQVYVALFGEGFTRYNLKEKTWMPFRRRAAGGVFNNWINTMMSDSKGRIWMGHYRGVDCFDPEVDSPIPLSCDSALSTTICYSLMEDRQGMIWIGTNNGLFGYEEESGELVHYTIEDGLPDNVICGLAEDEMGNIWCSTFRGICRIQNQDRVVHAYLSGYGLFDKEYSRSVYFQNKGEEAYFGGIYGITCFLPGSIQYKEIVRQPVLTRLFLNNQPASAHTVSAGKPIAEQLLTEASGFRLGHTDNSFSIEFSMMDYREPDNIFYEYRLSSVNDAWQQTAPGSNRITYNRLPPGEYTLHVRSSENGIYSPVKSLSVVIVPPWYATKVAKVFYGLLLLALAAVFIYYLRQRIRKQRQEEINEEKLKFFINISHEIRSPMTLIVSPLAMLMKRENDEVTTKALNSMYRNANRIVALLNQLLDIRRIDKGQMTMAFSEVDLVGFINELLGNFEYQAEKRNISLTFKHEPDSLPVWIDRNNFDKVLINLLHNAFKFTPAGGDVVISLQAKKEDNIKYAEICIQDTGIGLDEKKVERIFERFYQGSSITASGSGIGLNLCKTLVELHHGTITALNRDDRQGSCFRIRIPLGNAHLKKEEMVEQDDTPRFALERDISYELQEEANNRQKNYKTRQKVLVVDDNEEICLYLQQELSPFYKVVTCDRGAKALQTALEIIPDLIISDVVMPEMDGFELLKRIKTNANISHIPVILLTSRTEYDNRIKGWDKGADAILTKPFNMEELFFICNNLIAGRARLRGKFAGFQDQEEKMKPIELKSNDEQLMERLMAVINENIDNSGFTVEQLAENAGISRVQLHRKLKEITGIPAGEFIRNIRLKQAATLLKSKKVNISQVAYSVGYTSPSLFSAAFKKFYGVSPKEFVEKE
ncbi:signal transduction histidine kinase/ligand-binding sensor domain-containing protein/DNA-binding response OmpR family regulator [Parabacteroides sp. PFB2-12]|uniref:hybrid sensor histidine kinase/response regulator transcription factor n=1 Tax=unclassified Parabacteroides TaxID=2649774 RepID=UPI0024735B92|nr:MULTISPECIES: hybrid sensor histidine kinase/response regulator transcription factor [unclassified Parabacteroides]MDH6341877.1 signal transduction histidine kinase/ligand-binding sensor domain-containing protein/DNA-binding response OmpR family regulator [Parabacteroides sp. PM6-13]MDH6391584.1 signal transduction histidine kinase/ligand-binding sensor domain-containing protein/DNA-binding response OmpR family regulator [Parabacteroides sp. PFB2-12]